MPKSEDRRWVDIHAPGPRKLLGRGGPQEAQHRIWIGHFNLGNIEVGRSCGQCPFWFRNGGAENSVDLPGFELCSPWRPSNPWDFRLGKIVVALLRSLVLSQIVYGKCSWHAGASLLVHCACQDQALCVGSARGLALVDIAPGANSMDDHKLLCGVQLMHDPHIANAKAE